MSEPPAGPDGRNRSDVLLSADGVKMHFPLRGGLLGTVKGHVMAVDGVSLKLRRGETLAIVGESGCGKSTLARLLLRLLEPSAGRVYFMGHELTAESFRAVREERRHLQMVFQDPMSSLDPRMTIKNIVSEPLVVHQERRDRTNGIAALALLAVLGGFLSMALGAILIFNLAVAGYVGLTFLVAQRTLAGLVLVAYGAVGIAGGIGVWRLQNSAWWALVTVAFANLGSWAYLGLANISSPQFLNSWIGVAAASVVLAYLFVMRKQFRSGEELTQRVLGLLDLVGLKKEHLNRFPHEFSGGQRQRINIARALALNPNVIILDEPTSALDVSVQAQILNLLMSLQQKLGLTYLFITHDLSVVYHIADRVAVMYAGKIVELGTAEEIFQEPLHPYTKALISAAPVADPSVKAERIVLEGEVPSPTHPPSGCRFHPRCWLAFEPCARLEPPLVDVGGARVVACHAVVRDLGLVSYPEEKPAEGKVTT